MSGVLHLPKDFDFAAALAELREIEPLELRRSRIPKKLVGLQDWVDRRFPLDKFGWGVDGKDWNVVLSRGDFALDVKGTGRYLCNSAVSEICQKLDGEHLPAGVRKIEVLFDLKPMKSPLRGPIIDAKAMNNFIATTVVDGEEWFIGATPLDQNILGTRPPTRIRDKPPGLFLILASKEVARDGLFKPGDLMPFEGQMQPMANGLDGGIRWTDDKQGVVYQIWGSSYRLWNPITLVSDVAVDIQVSFPTARLGNLKDRLAGVSSVETPHGEQTFKKIVTEVGEAQSWNTLRDTDRSHELTRDGLTLLKNFMLKTPMFS